MLEFIFALSSVFLALPRIIVPLLWIFVRWFLTDPMSNWWWIVAGWLLAPFSLLLYCAIFQFNHGDWQMWQYALIGILAVVELIISVKNGIQGLGMGERE